jgi:hypothetical protein
MVVMSRIPYEVGIQWEGILRAVALLHGGNVVGMQELIG